MQLSYGAEIALIAITKYERINMEIYMYVHAYTLVSRMRYMTHMFWLEIERTEINESCAGGGGSPQIVLTVQLSPL